MRKLKFGHITAVFWLLCAPAFAGQPPVQQASPIVAGISTLGSTGGAANAPVNLIIDTDLSTDVGDVGAIALAAAYAKIGRANILGVIATSTQTYSSACARNLLDYALPSNAIPVALYNGTPRSGSNIGSLGYSSYTAICSNEFGRLANIGANFAGHVSVYRAILASAPNASVKIVVIGTMSSVADLLASGADSISSLTGPQLVAQKVSQIVFEAGKFPTETDTAGCGVTNGQTWNICQDYPAGQYVIANLPSTIPLVWLDDRLGNSVSDGPPAYADQTVSPYLRSYVAASTATRPAWDEMAVYLAVTGGNGYFTFSHPGTVAVDNTGNTAWTAGGVGNQTYVEFASVAVTANLAAEMTTLIASVAKSSPESATYAPPASDFSATIGVVAWYRPSDPASVLGSVTGLLDISGNGRNATIPTTMGGSNTAATAPTITTNAVNGLQALTFDGSHNALAVDAVAQALSGPAVAFDILMVAKIPTLPTSTQGNVFDFTSVGNGTHYLNRITGIAYYSALQCARVGSATGSPSSYSAAGTLNAATWELLECAYDPLSTNTYWNIGIVSPSGTGWTNAFTGGRSTDSANLALTIGRIGATYEDDGEANFNLGMSLAEMVVIKGRVISGAERLAKLRYLSNRYGLNFTF